jgi:putative permease
MQRVFRQLIHRYFSDEEAVILALLLLTCGLTIYWFGQILIPIIASLIITFILSPLVDRLVAFKIPYLMSVVLVMLAFVGLLLLALFGLLPLLIRQMTNLVSEIPRMYRMVMEQMQLLPEKFPELISDQNVSQWLEYMNSSEMSQQIADMAGQLVSLSLSTLPNLLSFIVFLVIVPILVFFMLKDRRELWAKTVDMLPKRRRMLTEIGLEMNDQFANYLRGKVTEILIVGTVSFVVFKVLGLNYAALLGLIVGLSVLIPYIGALAVTIPVAAIALFQWGWGPEFYTVVLAYTVIQALDGNVLVPLLFSEAVNLSPTAIIIAVLVFGGVWGFWGVFFAIPLATLSKAIYNAWPKHSEEEFLQAEAERQQQVDA